MQNLLNKKIIIPVVVVLLFILGVLFYGNFLNKNKNQTQENLPSLEVLGNKDNLLSFSILPGSTIPRNLDYIGVIEGGYFFEGNILINILDKDKNLLKAGYANATSDWMTSGPVAFQGALDLSNLPKGFIYIQILQDDPSGGESGLPVKEIFLPVFIE